jgi:hypothetical protein
MCRFVLGGLRRLEGEWLRSAALSDLLRTDPEYERMLAVHEIDGDSESALLHSLLEDLRVFGLAELAGEPGQSVALRGKAPQSPAVPDLPAKPLTVPPNLEVVVPLVAPFAVLIRLCRFAELKTLDVAAVFSLTERSLLRGATRGIALEEAKAFLANQCNHPLPEVVDQLFADVSAREGEVRILPTGGVLSLKDPDLEAAIQEHPEIGPLVLARLAPGVFALHPEVDVNGLVETLKRLGFFAVLA